MNVSITVICYNSSDTIVDTLDSILAQNYCTKNIELVISDDASTDNCVETIDQWLSIHSQAFLNINFIKNKVNQGVTGNCNTAWRAATCDWIKPIAGDDMLKTNCISDNVAYIKSHPECKVLFSEMEWFGNIEQITPSPYDIKFFKKDSKSQNNWLSILSFNIAPSAFINKNLLAEVGYTDNRFKNLEDLPLWIKITKAGHRLHFLNKVTVSYRSAESISMSNHRYVNMDFFKDLIAINKSQAGSFRKSPIKECIRHEQLLFFNLTLLIGRISGNKKSRYTNYLRRSTWFFRPIHIVHQIHCKAYNALKINKKSKD